MQATLCFLAVLVFLVAITIVQPHGGGLDAYGCHDDRKRGGSLCHRGPLVARTFPSKDEMLRVLKEQ